LANGSSSTEDACASHIPPVAETLECKLGLLLRVWSFCW
jgi:hypothetical protein